MNIFTYVSYEDLKGYQDVPNESDDDLLRELCETASRMWDGYTNRHFSPWRETRYYDYITERGDPLGYSARARLARFTEPWATTLKVDEDLLEVKTLQTANGDVTIAASDYNLKCGHTYNQQPYDRIELIISGDVAIFTFSDTYQKANIVDGIWGFHDAYAQAFQDSQDTVQDDPLTAAATSLTVSDADGADAFGVTPRFKAQQLLKIEDEYLYVTVKTTSTNVLTVIRGVNGTTAASHAQNTTIYVYQPMRDIWHSVRRLAAWLYGQKDSPFFETQISPQLGTITIPPAAPIDVRVKANYYTRN